MFINKYSTNANKYQYIKVLSAKKGSKYFELLIVVYIFVIILFFKTKFMSLEERLLKRFRESSEADEVVLTDRTILDTIELYGLPEEEGVEEFVEKLTPIFKTVAGQSRFLLSKIKEEKEEELERIKAEIKEKELEGNQQEETDETTNNQMEKLLEALKQTIENQGQKVDSLSQELNEFKTKETKAKINNALEDFAKSKGLADSYVLEKVIQSLNVDGKDVDSLKQELESSYAEEFKKCRGTEPSYGGSSSGGADREDAEWEAYFKAKEAEEAQFSKQKE